MDVVIGGLEEVDGGDSMQPLSFLLDVHVESDVILSKIFHFVERTNDVSTEVIENENLPQVLSLTVDLAQ